MIKLMKIYESILYDREDMPQVSNIPNAIKKLKDMGVAVNSEKMKPSDMLPSQTTLDMEKVESMAKDISIKDMKRIVVSVDNHIVDGHHRWAALKYAGFGNDKIPVYCIQLNRRMAIQKYNDVADLSSE
jgi:ParB-like chromosome segregation protein Spo0J